MTDELKRLLRESFEYSMTDVHTCFPGVVEKYDPKTRRADIQPSLKRRLPDGTFAAFPIIPDIPVQFPGTKKVTFHFPLEKGDEVSVNVIERSTDIWRDNGGSGIEDGDPRRFNLQDCYAVPGLQPVDFITVTEPGINIIYKTDPDGDITGIVTMDDDTVRAKYKEESFVEIKKDLITATNGKITAKLNGAKASLKNASKNLFKMWDTHMKNIIGMKTVGSPCLHVIHPQDITKLQQDNADMAALLEE